MKKPDTVEFVCQLPSILPKNTNLMARYDLESYLEKLNSSSRTSNFASQPVLQNLDFGDRTTFTVKPPTERTVSFP